MGIRQGATSTSTLAYRKCANSEKQALFRMDLTGQIPNGSTIVSATLRINPVTQGDGNLFRVAEPWDGSSTWASLGDVATLGVGKPAGTNTGQTKEIDVTDHVVAWLGGAANLGWVLKGQTVDCLDAVIHNGSALENVRPRLTILYIPPDTTAPRVADIDVGSSLSGHPTYDVPVGSGLQLKTVPVGRVNRILVGYTEDVTNVSAASFTLVDSNSGAAIPFTVSHSGSVTTISLTSPITSPTQVALTVKTTIRDAANNALDGNFNNPASVATASSQAFPSGDGVPGGEFDFFFTVLPGDYNRSNVVESGDWTICSDNSGLGPNALFTQGDGDGDGDVDSTDLSVYYAAFGTDFTNW